MAAFGGVQPDEDLELEPQLVGVVAGLGEEPPPAPQRDIVRAAFEQARFELPGQPLAQPGQVLAHELLLKRVRVSRNDDTLSMANRTRDGRHQVSQALAGTSARLDEQVAAAGLDLRNGEEHLE